VASQTLIIMAYISTLMMEAVQTSETLVNSYQSTWCYNPEDSHLHSHRHENLKSHLTLNLRLTSLKRLTASLLPTRKFKELLQGIPIRLEQATCSDHQIRKHVHTLRHFGDTCGSQPHLETISHPTDIIKHYINHLLPHTYTHIWT
jgi:hypothetical protein